jgi:NosR/NirI family transcriptional regulator, nitrous oxide reductase regulator
VARAGLAGLALLLVVIGATEQAAARSYGAFFADVEPGEVFPGADRFGEPEGEPAAMPAYRGDELLGYVFLNTDAVDSIGYSGKPIKVLIGLDVNGTVVGAKVVEHHEPILLVGIPEGELFDFTTRLVGSNLFDAQGALSRGDAGAALDLISGGTVTAMVVRDSVRRAALAIARSRQLGGATATPTVRRGSVVTEPASFEERDWAELLGDGSIRRLRLSVGEINAAFEQMGEASRKGQPEPGAPDDVFLDLYAALVTPPTIGRALLSEREYAGLMERLAPGDQAMVIAGLGPFSFKGSGYVRGGIFDRFEIVQDAASLRFRDKQHKRLGEITAAGAPEFREVGLFVIPADAGFDPLAPWRLELVVPRAVGPIDKVFTSFALSYDLPERYIRLDPADPVPASAGTLTDLATLLAAEEESSALWREVWERRAVDIGVLSTALVILTLIFFAQNWLVRRPRLALTVRIVFLLFTLGWIGGYAGAQLSVVNIFTFAHALATGFSWEFFLLDPLIFILWIGVALSLVFWGRGAFCGWLCPFGALQELLNRLAKLAHVPQIRVPWGVHERLWPVKYVIFVALIGLSLHSLAFAEQAAEVEPFKTAIVLKFAREWWFIAWAGALLVAGLFIERFFCRYLCPLGAGLAIPGRMRTMDWLRRRKQCGTECQLCRTECMVGAIHPEGHINPNECLYCLHCQVVYKDDHRCPPLAQKRSRRERRAATAAVHEARRTAQADENVAGAGEAPTP